MTNQQGAPEALRPIQRYKIGYHTDEWGVRSSTPGGISDPSGQWVLYKDHIAALVEAQQPAPSAAVFGLRLVPVEPTDQMVQAAHHIDLSYMPGQEGADRAAIYRAMIAAAPQPAVQQWNDLIGKETHADADGLLVWRDEVDFAAPTPQADSAPLAAPADIVVLEAALRAIHQAIDLIGEPDTERLRTVRRVLRGAVVVAEDSTAPQAASQPAPVRDYPPLPEQVAWRDSVEHCDLYWRPAVQAQNDLEPLFTKQQMRAYVDADRAASAPADSVTAPARQGKWTWVPVEPSTAMLVAGNHGQPGDFSALKVWQDMLGALERSFDYTRPVDPPSAAAQMLTYGHECSDAEASREMVGEPVFAFRRKGLDDFCTCTEERYAELSAKPNLFETRIFYTTPPAQAADSVLEDADPIRALIAEHAAILDQNESAYFELCYHRVTGWMAWITDKPLCMPPVISPDRKVLAQGQGDTADEACRDAARKQGGAT